MGLNAAEKAVLIEFLEDLSQRYGNDHSNEYQLPDTPENRELVKAACGKGWHVHRGEILTIGFLLVDYLIERLKRA